MNIEESVERYFNKFNEVLKLVEEKCVNGNEDFATTLNENVYWNSKYLQKIFGYIGLSTLFQTNFFRLFSRYCTGVWYPREECIR